MIDHLQRYNIELVDMVINNVKDIKSEWSPTVRFESGTRLSYTSENVNRYVTNDVSFLVGLYQQYKRKMVCNYATVSHIQSFIGN